MTNDALVLAGGGVAGIAWEIGVLHGLEEAEPAAAAPVLDEGTVLVGTAAGSVVAAQIGGGTSLAALFEAQLAPESAELSVEFDAAAFMATMAAALDGAASAQEGRQSWDGWPVKPPPFPSTNAEASSRPACPGMAGRRGAC